MRTLLENTAKLLEAAREGNIEEVTRLISEGANVNATAQDEKTPLHWATEMGYKDAVKALLGLGATSHWLQFTLGNLNVLN
ncbi:ankyrin repeat domain-containing protein, partial [Wolbachia pipientis]